MITDFVLNAIFGGLNALLSLVPSVTIWDASSAADASTVDVIHNASNVFPLAFLVGGLLSLLALRIALDGWDFLVWVYHQFWGGD